MQSKSINLKFRSMPTFDRGNDLNLYKILNDVQPNDDRVILKTYSNLNNEHVMNGRYFYF